MRQSRQASVERDEGRGRSASGKRSSDIRIRSIRNDVDILARKIKALEAQREKRLNGMHEECPHPHEHIIEAKYRDGYFGATPPFRVCKLCGYAEEGWYCGYWKLSTREECPTLSRDAAQKYVLKFHSQDDLSKKRFPNRTGTSE